MDHNSRNVEIVLVSKVTRYSQVVQRTGKRDSRRIAGESVTRDYTVCSKRGFRWKEN